MTIYILTTYFRSGGPENAHLTCSLINSMSIDKFLAYIVYIDKPNLNNIYPEIDNVNICHLDGIIDQPSNVIIICEIFCASRLRSELQILHCQIVVWWLSFINASINYTLSNVNHSHVMHAFHSYYEYAMVLPHLSKNQKYFFLTDYLADEYLNVESTAFIDQKENIVCFNGHRDYLCKIICEENDIQYISIKNMNRTQVNQTLQKCKIYVDLGTHPGKDHLPREAAMYGCIVITNKSGSAAYFEDVPIEEKITFPAELPPLIQKMMNDYERYYTKQEHYRKIIKNEKQVALNNILYFVNYMDNPIYKTFQFIPFQEYANIINNHRWILDKIKQIVLQTLGNAEAEGNYFTMNGNIEVELPELVPKQQNIFSIATNAHNILEIGFNAGHSTLLFLLANPSSNITCIDTCTHLYVKPCFDYLHSIFGDRIQLLKGNSKDIVPTLPKNHYDIIHIDGDHSINTFKTDFANVYHLSPKIIIVNDTQEPSINSTLGSFILSPKFSLKEIKMLGSDKYQHRFVMRYEEEEEKK